MSDPARKPGEAHDRYVERLIREAQEEGAFAGVGGEGKRLPLTGSLEPGWWAKEKLRREKLSDLPDALAIRLEAERVLAEVARLSDERIVRERLEELNGKIRRLNRTHVSGPPTSVAPADVEAVVARWRAARVGGTLVQR